MIFPVLFAGYLVALALIIVSGIIVWLIASVISSVISVARFRDDRGGPRPGVSSELIGAAQVSNSSSEMAVEWRSTPAMRARIRELARPDTDDYDRAVIAVLDDFENMLGKPL